MGWDFRGATTVLSRPRGGLCVASCWHNTSGRLSGDGEGLHVAGPRFQGGSGAHICCAPVSNPNLGRTQFPLFPAPSTTNCTLGKRREGSPRTPSWREGNRRAQRPSAFSDRIPLPWLCGHCDRPEELGRHQGRGRAWAVAQVGRRKTEFSMQYQARLFGNRRNAREAIHP